MIGQEFLRHHQPPYVQAVQAPRIETEHVDQTSGPTSACSHGLRALRSHSRGCSWRRGGPSYPAHTTDDRLPCCTGTMRWLSSSIRSSRCQRSPACSPSAIVSTKAVRNSSCGSKVTTTSLALLVTDSPRDLPIGSGINTDNGFLADAIEFSVAWSSREGQLGPSQTGQTLPVESPHGVRQPVWAF
jgi:hypothetical protein